MRYVILVLIVLTIPILAQAATLKVPSQYPTIQDAIDISVNGDTVQVAPGTYVENIDFKGKAITVESELGPDVTIIDGNQAGSAVTIASGEPPSAVLDGFTVTNGSGTIVGSYPCGGGIFCGSYASPIISNNIIIGNSARDGGGIFSNINTSPTIINNRIVSNYVIAEGGGLKLEYASPAVHNNVISGNTAFRGGGMLTYKCTNWTVENNIVYGNEARNEQGGGLMVYKGTNVVNNNVIFGNRAKTYGGGLYCDSSATVTNNTLYNNVALITGGGFFCIDTPIIANTIVWKNIPDQISGGNPTVAYCDIEGGWAGMGNINADPLFVAGPTGFYYLSQVTAGQPTDSPCVNTGSGPAGNFGMDIYWTRTDEVPDSGTVDMGFHYGNFMFPTLQADTFFISESTGGDADFLLLAESGNGNRNYILLGSITGTDPGIPLPGGQTILPLNWDIFTNLVIGLINTPVFSNFMGKLDGAGSAGATFDTLTQIPGAAGLTMHFAYALSSPWDFVSIPVGIEITP